MSLEIQTDPHKGRKEEGGQRCSVSADGRRTQKARRRTWAITEGQNCVRRLGMENSRSGY